MNEKINEFEARAREMLSRGFVSGVSGGGSVMFHPTDDEVERVVAMLRATNEKMK